MACSAIVLLLLSLGLAISLQAATYNDTTFLVFNNGSNTLKDLNPSLGLTGRKAGTQANYNDKSKGPITYGLWFVNTSIDSFFLSVVAYVGDYTVPGYYGQIIWTANRYDPVRDNASLRFDKQGNFVLQDWDGRTAWSSNTSGLGVQKLLMDDNGNLALLNAKGKTVWQSFDHPVDTILLYQAFKVKMQLTAPNSSYVLSMESNGLVLYANLPDPTPYWLLTASGDNSLSSAKNSSQSGLYAVICRNYLGEISLDFRLPNYSPVEESNFILDSVCDSFNSTWERRNLLNSNGQLIGNTTFFRLEADGDIHSYSWDSTVLKWQTLFSLFEDKKCDLPDICGPYGICYNGTCQGCPDKAYFEYVSPTKDPSLGCKPISSGKSNPGFILLSLPNTSFFYTRYGNATYNMVSSSDQCSQLCMNNSVCKGAFYNLEKGSCYITSQTGTLQYNAENSTFTAFLKVESIQYTYSNRSKRGYVIGLVLGLGIPALIFIVVALICLRRWRRQMQKREDKGGSTRAKEDAMLHSLAEVGVKRFTYKDIEGMTGGFLEILGAGGFGTVYKGKLSDGSIVAVKKLENSRQGMKEFTSEVAILGTVHHCNVVRLLGYCAQGASRILVYEYMPNGSLEKWLFGDVKPLPWPVRFNIALGVAKGLAYMHHECIDKILHLDLKPQNILLDLNFSPKISDFGLAKLINKDQSGVMTTMRGTPGYLAPEWIMDQSITDRSDVYSFGILLMEIVSGRKHKYMMNDKSVVDLIDILDLRVREESDLEEVLRVIKVGVLCSQADPSVRPSMNSVVQMLEGSVAIPDHIIPGSWHSPFGSTSNIGTTSSSGISQFSTSSNIPYNSGSTDYCRSSPNALLHVQQSRNDIDLSEIEAR